MIGRLRTWLLRTLYPYGVVRKIWRGPLRGGKYWVAPGMGFTFAWHINGEQWSNMAALAGTGQCVYDIGANRGQSTLHLAHVVGAAGRVIAFEPMPEVYADLQRNLQLNGLSQVLAVNSALAEREGEAEFLFDPQRPTQGKLAGVEPTNPLTGSTSHVVRLLRLNDYQKHGWPPPALIKVDVEGGAASVLAGADDLIAACRPVVFIELHGPEEQLAVHRMLEKHSYQAYTLDGVLVADPRNGNESVLVCRPLGSHPGS
jgi:FkbM family methyltransferase